MAVNSTAISATSTFGSCMPKGESVLVVICGTCSRGFRCSEPPRPATIFVSCPRPLDEAMRSPSVTLRPGIRPCLELCDRPDAYQPNRYLALSKNPPLNRNATEPPAQLCWMCLPSNWLIQMRAEQLVIASQAAVAIRTEMAKCLKSSVSHELRKFTRLIELRLLVSTTRSDSILKCVLKCGFFGRAVVTRIRDNGDVDRQRLI